MGGDTSGMLLIDAYKTCISKSLNCNAGYSYISAIAGSQLTLSQLVQQVADVCGLEVRLVAHARNVSSLLEQAPATHG